MPLGSKVNGRGEEEFPGNGYRAISPSQFLQGDRVNKETPQSPPSAEKLALTFATMEKGMTITPMQYDPADSTVNYRVQGKAFFKPDLRRWSVKLIDFFTANLLANSDGVSEYPISVLSGR